MENLLRVVAKGELSCFFPQVLMGRFQNFFCSFGFLSKESEGRENERKIEKNVLKMKSTTKN